MAYQPQNGIRVKAIEAAGSSGPLKVFLDDSEREFDLVICATGVKPTIDYLAGSSIEIGKDGGIVVDLSMRTNAADVFAAGDCTEAADFSTGVHFVNATSRTPQISHWSRHSTWLDSALRGKALSG